MLRSSCLITRLTPLSIQLQSVRWKRKPRKPFWLGTAKSKRFIIKDPPAISDEEKAELHRLDRHYRASMRSIRKYLENWGTQKGEADEAKSQTVTTAKIEESLAVNEEWNKQSAIFRAKRMEGRIKEHEEVTKTTMEKINIRQQLFLQRIEQLVIQEKENSKSFITPENLDQKIEECLSSITDYNFAIDTEGQMYTDYESKMKSSPLNVNYCQTLPKS